MLQTIEDYAAQRLAQRPDAATTGARHTHFFVTLAEQAQPWLRGPDPTSWLDVLEREHDNIRATLARLEGAGGEQARAQARGAAATSGASAALSRKDG